MDKCSMESHKRRFHLLNSNLSLSIVFEFYDLEKLGLIECLNPEKMAWKAYMITELGKRVYEYFKKHRAEVRKRNR